MEIYLDNNSSTPIDERVLAIMENVYLHSYGNADSRTHNHGERARTIVENARKQVASLLGINSSEVFFTSGSTESNNIAIQGLEEYAIETNKKHIITSAIEHKSVLETIKMMKKKGFDVDIVNPGLSGQVNAQEILDKVREDTLLVSIMHVNNETGIIQPVSACTAAIKQSICSKVMENPPGFASFLFHSILESIISQKELIRYENLFKIIYQEMHFIMKIIEREQSYGTESKRFEKCPETSGKYAGPTD